MSLKSWMTIGLAAGTCWAATNLSLIDAVKRRDTSGADKKRRAAKREHDWGALDKLKLKK